MQSNAPVPSGTQAKTGSSVDNTANFAQSFMDKLFSYLEKYRDGPRPEPRYSQMSAPVRRLCHTPYSRVGDSRLKLLKLLIHLDGYGFKLNLSPLDMGRVSLQITWQRVLDLCYATVKRYERAAPFVWYTHKKDLPGRIPTVEEREALAQDGINRFLLEEPDHSGHNLILTEDEARTRFRVPLPSLEQRKFISACEVNETRVRLGYKPKGAPDCRIGSPAWRHLHRNHRLHRWFQTRVWHQCLVPLFERRARPGRYGLYAVEYHSRLARYLISLECLRLPSEADEYSRITVIGEPRGSPTPDYTEPLQDLILKSLQGDFVPQLHENRLKTSGFSPPLRSLISGARPLWAWPALVTDPQREALSLPVWLTTVAVVDALRERVQDPKSWLQTEASLVFQVYATLDGEVSRSELRDIMRRYVACAELRLSLVVGPGPHASLLFEDLSDLLEVKEG